MGALNVLWDLPPTPVRAACMDALVILLEEWESARDREPATLGAGASS
jgi:hypothetical protein